MSRTAIIVGGGIGGLAAATALRRNGFEVTVYERAQTAAQIQVGGGIHVWHNGMRALGELGLAEGVEAAGALVEHADFRTWRGDLLARWEVGSFGRRIGVPTVGVSRADLHPVLLDAQPEGTLQFGRVLKRYSADADGVTAYFEDGTEERADLLIGADGIGSAVRAQLHGTDEKPRYSGYSVWQAIVDYDMAHERVPLGDFELHWGPGSRFAYYHVGGERMYWFGLSNAPPRGTDPPGLRDVILERFSGWPDPIASMIEATDDAAITRNDICDRRPSRRWGQGRVTLLGDAAHAMTFNVSQGACQTLEDSVVLMRCLEGTGDIETALRAYEKRRYDRTAPIQRRAYRIGAVGRWENRAACRFRDSVMGFAFPRFVVKGHEREMVSEL